MAILRLLFLFSLLFCSIFPAAAGELAGKIDDLRGESQVVRGSTRFPAAIGMQVFEGDRFTTGKSARLRIAFVDGSLMQLGQEAEAVVRRYRSGDTVDALLELVGGRSRFIIEKLRQGGSSYQIETRTALIGVRGTDILAQVESQADHVALVDGHIELTRSGADAAIAVGNGEYVALGASWPVAPAAIPESWLNDFIADVGPSRSKSRKGVSDDAASVPNEAIRSQSAGRLAAPIILPR